METSVVRAHKDGPWRLRAWPGDPSIAHLILTDHTHLPTTTEVAGAVDRARQSGVRAVRTSALFPPAMATFAAVGFDHIDTLVLLRLDQLAQLRLAPPTRRTHHLYPWQRTRAADVDRAAFGTDWGNDAASLAEVCRATPQHRARWIAASGRHPRFGAFAISGAAGRNGYLQRLATHPDARRSGLATDLVADALQWMRTLRLDSVLVNTGVTNVEALALYERFGFVPLDEQLAIAELRFHS